MATKNLKALKRVDNATMLAAVWNEASTEYQKRIPLADQGEIAKTIQHLDRYPDLCNELVTSLINRVGLVVMQTNSWTNPLKPLKKGMMEYGETIEEIRTNLIQAVRYDPNECYTDVFACHDVETETAFHSINRQDMYQLTVNKMMLRRAFTTEYGLQEYITQLMETPYTSDEYDEYLIMKNLFKLYDEAYGYYRVQIPQIANPLAGGEVMSQAQAIAASIEELKFMFDFMKSDYNGLGWPTSSRGYKIIVFARPHLAAVLNTYVIPFAFRDTNAIDLDIIPIDDFGIPGCEAIMCDERHLMVYDTYMEFASIQNPRGRSWNYWWHHDGIYSLSKFVNAVMFTTEAGSVTPPAPTYNITAVTPAIAPAKDGTVPTFAPKGDEIHMTATVEGTTDPVGAEVPQAVMWFVSGQTSQRTWIDNDGWLHVGTDEEAAKVTVMAVTPYRNADNPEGVSGTVEVGIGAAIAEAVSAEAGE